MSKTVQDWQAGIKAQSWWKPEWGDPDARLGEWLYARPKFPYVDLDGDPCLEDVVALYRRQDHRHNEYDDGRRHDPSNILDCSVCMKALYDMFLGHVLSTAGERT